MILNEMPQLLKPREVAEYFQVSLITIKRWAQRGALPYVTINKRGDRRFRKEDIIIMIKGHNVT